MTRRKSSGKPRSHLSLKKIEMVIGAARAAAAANSDGIVTAQAVRAACRVGFSNEMYTALKDCGVLYTHGSNNNEPRYFNAASWPPSPKLLADVAERYVHRVKGYHNSYSGEWVLAKLDAEFRELAGAKKQSSKPIDGTGSKTSKANSAVSTEKSIAKYLVLDKDGGILDRFSTPEQAEKAAEEYASAFDTVISVAVIRSVCRKVVCVEHKMLA